MLKILKRFTKTEWLLAVCSIVFIALQVWLDLEMPTYMSKITVLVQSTESKMSDIWYNGLMMLLCALGSLISAISVAFFAAKISANCGMLLREKLFKKVQSFSMAEIGKFSTASLITRSTNDVTQVQMFIVMGLQMLIKAPIMAVWSICKIASSEWQWTLSMAVSVIVLLAVVGICIALALPKFKKMQKLTDDLNRVARENLNGLSVVRAYNAEDYQERKFETANKEMTDTTLYAHRTMAFMTPSIQLIMSGLSLAIYWIGAVIINQAGIVEKMNIFGSMMTFSQYAVQVVMAFMMLVMIFMILPRASVAAGRINEVLDTDLTIKDGTLDCGKQGREGEVVFKNVSFKYPDAEEYVLQNISFTANKGETVAFIGSTGSGKSTVINLVPRFYDATDGEVFVDGINVKDYNQKALRNKIGYISQKATLFTGSVRSNIAYGDNGKPLPNADEVAEAVEIAQAKDFVEGLNGKYDGYVAQGGSNFSGGQKQRLSIARAIARKPEILIFDDSFSALDYKTDKILRKKLDEKCTNVTRLIVAQRIGTIRNADKIVVLDEGKVAGVGSHNELMKSCEVYRQIALSQLSKEELE